MLSEKEIRKLTERTLAHSRADQTQVLWLGIDEALTRFANNEIHQNVSETQVAYVIQVAFGKKIATVSTNILTEAGIDRALEQAEQLAKMQPENPDFPGFTAPPSPTGQAAYDEATAGATPELRARAVGEAIRYSLDHKVNASGAFRTGTYQWAIHNSQGLWAMTPTTLSDLTIVAMTETSSGYAANSNWRVGMIDVAAHGREAVDKALRAQNPRPIDPGDYPVVLEPYAVADLAHFLGGNAAGAVSFHEGQSWMSDRVGEALVSPAITLRDDPHDPDLWPIPFDFEGVATRPVDFLTQGVVGTPVYDRTWAAKTGNTSTGHGIPPFNPFMPTEGLHGMGATPLHVEMLPGDSDLPTMIAGVKRGIYVTRFNYTRVVHPREMIVTGLTRDGTFLIENGEIAYPVRNLRFTQSYVAALQDVRAVGRTLHNEKSYFAVSRVPALCLGAFTFTGTTTF